MFRLTIGSSLTWMKPSISVQDNVAGPNLFIYDDLPQKWRHTINPIKNARLTATSNHLLTL